ncbi:MAG: gliding motility-associated C-terminal domain-containing protein [Bacteroidota bacterium]
MAKINLQKKISTRILGLLSIFYWSVGTPFFNQNHTQNPNLQFSIETTDHVIVVKNNTVTFDYLEQADTEGPVQIRVIETPKFGEVQLNDDQSFKYTPSPDLCAEDDEFVYLLIEGDQTTKIAVSIEILCETLTIFNGISQSEEDKKVANFKIMGVENFPNNALHIFDNEGKEIYEVEQYKNDWAGDVDSSDHLIKDNLYYYVFNDGKGNYYSGYLMKN